MTDCMKCENREALEARIDELERENEGLLTDNDTLAAEIGYLEDQLEAVGGEV